ncbi:lipase family protein [Streptomyces olivoreticuli]|uniref:lipase family protein n=1 Tax=Streptomyces olivoreticuli TaxID=68246 RepID=UPI000E289C16|nr:lipase family protein [Streptomyces olivoreticuli]
MHLRSTALATVAALAFSLGLSGTGAAADGPAAAAPGDVLSSAPTSFHPLPFQPTNTRAWHITYRSTTAKGAPNVVSGTVIVPQDGRTGPRPLVSYAVGTVGLADKCAPSAGFPYGTTVEANLIQQLTLRGWAVAVTDYEGLGTPGDHTYIVGRAEGQAVLDAARAALRLPEAGLAKDSPVGVMGYSQGGHAGSWAAELHDSYAPELNLKGTATGGVPADLLKTADHNNGNIGAGFILMAAIGQNAAYPELRLDTYLNDRGRHLVDYLKNNCVAANTAAGLFERISDVTVRNPLYEPDWQRVLRASNLGSHAPDRPVYLYHGVIDELIPYAIGQQLRADWCAKGVPVEWHALPLGEHVLGAITESIPAANWLARRFAGEPAGSNC